MTARTFGNAQASLALRLLILPVLSCLADVSLVAELSHALCLGEELLSLGAISLVLSAHGLQGFANFLANQLCGNWQVTTTSRDVHDAFEYKRNAVKRDIENCGGLSSYQKALYCQQSDRQIMSQEIYTKILLWGMNRLR